MEVKIKCRGCNRDISVMKQNHSQTCLFCKTNNTSTSGHWISSRIRTYGGKYFKYGIPDSVNHSSAISPSSSGLGDSSKGSPSSYNGMLNNKRAVLCGVTYRKRKFKLKGTINDVKNMKELLITRFGFQEDEIRVLTEEENMLPPTKKNIEDSLKWLVRDCQNGDSLVFYFSGHGLQQIDSKEEELDGLVEILCPVDFIQEGMIFDSDLKATIVQPLQEGVTLHAIIDACHSGTILDLTYVYDSHSDCWLNSSTPSKEPRRKCTSGGLAICLSACADNQMTADTSAFGKGMNGVMTFLMTKIINENPKSDLTYWDLLQKIYQEIKKINQTRWLKFMGKLFRNQIRYVEDPVLSSSEKFDLKRRKFIL